MQLNLEGKRALVTGGSRGIGRAIVDVLAEEGCDVIAASRSASADQHLLLTKARTGRRLIPCTADLSTPGGVEAAIDCVAREFAGLDILVNNAGSARRADFFALTEADWQDGFALKFFGYVRTTRAAWPLLKAAHGSIVNIVGVSARTPEAVYTIAGFCESRLACIYQEHGGNRRARWHRGQCHQSWTSRDR